MRRITLQGTGITSTALGFGCAGVFREPTRRGRLRVLAEAYDLGIRHFDVAPMYGLGLAEAELGEFSAPRRESLTIVSKYGIAMTPVGRALGLVQGPLRRLLQARPGLRSQAQSAAGDPSLGRAGRTLYSRPSHQPVDVRARLERTLRALRTNYLDLLLLHDPSPADVASAELCMCLEEMRAAGLIRAWGVTGHPEQAIAVLRAATRPVPVVQYHYNALSSGSATQRLRDEPARIVYGILDGVVGRVVRHVSADSTRRARWESETGLDCASGSVVGNLLLRQAGRENADGVVLFSSIDSGHVRSAAEAFSRPIEPVDPQLDAFLALIDAEIVHSAGSGR